MDKVGIENYYHMTIVDGIREVNGTNKSIVNLK